MNEGKIKHRKPDGSVVYLTFRQHRKLARRQFSPWRRSPLESRLDYVSSIAVMIGSLLLAGAAILYGLLRWIAQ